MCDETVQADLFGDVTTDVVNQKKTNAYDVDIGRADDGESNMNNTEVGNDGWLGNPYPLHEGYGREESIELFREDFIERLRNDDEFRAAVENLEGKTLACWCKPKACHGDVIASFIRDGFDAITNADNHDEANE